MKTTIALGRCRLIRRRPARIAGITQKIDSSGHTTSSISLSNRTRRKVANSLLGRRLETTSTCTSPLRAGLGASVRTVMSHLCSSFPSSLLARIAVGVVSGANDCETHRSRGRSPD